MNLRLALSTIIIPATIAISAATDTLTIATYNIRNCIGMDMTQDIDRTAKAKRLKPTSSPSKRWTAAPIDPKGLIFSVS